MIVRLNLFCFLILLPLTLFGQIEIEQSYIPHSFNHGSKIPPLVYPMDCSKVTCTHIHHFQLSPDSTLLNTRLNCSNTFQLWASFDGPSLIEELKLYDDYECFRSLFAFEEGIGEKLFSKNNFILACNELASLSKNYTGEGQGNMYGLMIYLHSFLYHEFNQASINLGFDEISLLKITVLEYLKNPNIYKETLGAFKNLGEFYNLCDYDGIRSLSEVTMSFKKTLLSLTIDDRWKVYTDPLMEYYLYIKTFGVNYAVFRGVANNDQSFIDYLDNDQEFLSLLASSVNEIELDALQYLAECPRLIIVELLRMCNIPSLVDNVEPLLASIAKTRPKYSSFWYRCIVAINMKGNCEVYELCEDLEEAKSKVLQNIFPNKWIFEDGKITISTPLDFNAAQILYYASREVECQFFRLNKSNKPLPDDKSDSLKIFIYGSRAAYQEWQYVLNGINTNNGGIYIESTATFYTFDRINQQFTLEELFRHEYAHYLVGRFLDPFLWGQTIFYTNEQLTWFNEGIAEHLSGSTAREGIKLRQSIGWELSNDASKMSIASIVSAKYNNGFAFYRYANILIRFLVEEEPIIFKNMTSAIKALDIEKYKAIISNLSTTPLYETKFQTFLQKSISQTNEWFYPKTAIADISSLELKNINDVKLYFNTLDNWKNSSISQSATLSLERFKIEINKNEVGCEIDDCLNLLRLGKNNLEYSVGYEVIEDDKNLFVITGPLGSPLVKTIDLENNDIKVYPNPCSQTITIEWLNHFERMEILNQYNQEVFKYLDLTSNKINVDLSYLPPALYFLKLTDGMNSKIVKFIKI